MNCRARAEGLARRLHAKVRIGNGGGGGGTSALEQTSLVAPGPEDHYASMECRHSSLDDPQLDLVGEDGLRPIHVVTSEPTLHLCLPPPPSSFNHLSEQDSDVYYDFDLASPDDAVEAEEEMGEEATEKGGEGEARGRAQERPESGCVTSVTSPVMFDGEGDEEEHEDGDVPGAAGDLYPPDGENVVCSPDADLHAVRQILSYTSLQDMMVNGCEDRGSGQFQSETERAGYKYNDVGECTCGRRGQVGGEGLVLAAGYEGAITEGASEAGEYYRYKNSTPVTSPVAKSGSCWCHVTRGSLPQVHRPAPAKHHASHNLSTTPSHTTSNSDHRPVSGKESSAICSVENCVMINNEGHRKDEEGEGNSEEQGLGGGAGAGAGVGGNKRFVARVTLRHTSLETDLVPEQEHDKRQTRGGRWRSRRSRSEGEQQQAKEAKEVEEGLVASRRGERRGECDLNTMTGQEQSSSTLPGAISVPSAPHSPPQPHLYPTSTCAMEDDDDEAEDEQKKDSTEKDEHKEDTVAKDKATEDEVDENESEEEVEEDESEEEVEEDGSEEEEVEEDETEEEVDEDESVEDDREDFAVKDMVEAGDIHKDVESSESEEEELEEDEQTEEEEVEEDEEDVQEENTEISYMEDEETEEIETLNEEEQEHCNDDEVNEEDEEEETILTGKFKNIRGYQERVRRLSDEAEDRTLPIGGVTVFGDLDDSNVDQQQQQQQQQQVEEEGAQEEEKEVVVDESVSGSELASQLSELQVEDVGIQVDASEDDGAAGEEAGTRSSSEETDPERIEDFKMRIKRSSSLKCGKTPPGTPGRKKIVRFADMLGLDLAAVRTFLGGGVPHVPRSAFWDLQVDEKQQAASAAVGLIPNTQTQLPRVPIRVLTPLFQQPGCQLNFLERVRNQRVVVESVDVGDDMSVRGVVRVLNLDYHKQVQVRYTFDQWRNFHEATATYIPGSYDGLTDRFSFLLWGSFLQDNGALVFCVKYQTLGQEFWDNNYGRNYSLQCYTTTGVPGEKGPAGSPRPQNSTSVQQHFEESSGGGSGSRHGGYQNSFHSTGSPTTPNDPWTTTFF